MKEHEIQNLKRGVTLARQFTRRQIECTLAMALSAALAFFLSSVLAPGIDGFGLANAAATGLTVGVWCQPDAYRRRNGSLALAITLIGGMWSVSLIAVLISYFG